MLPWLMDLHPTAPPPSHPELGGAREATKFLGARLFDHPVVSHKFWLYIINRAVPRYLLKVLTVVLVVLGLISYV